MTARRAHTQTATANPAMPALALLALAAAAITAPPVHAQSMGSSANDFSIPYGQAPGEENRGVDPNTRDANGNRVIINGRILLGEEVSNLPRTLGGGGWSGYGGTAIGNQLNVVVQGNRNTVIIDSTQINNGDVTTDGDLNGEIDLDG